METIKNAIITYINFIQHNYILLFIFILIGIVGMLFVYWIILFDKEFAKEHMNLKYDTTPLILCSWITIISYIIHRILKPLYIKLGILVINNCPLGGKCILKNYSCFKNDIKNKDKTGLEK